jgi:large subunit ribosomal protein L25
MNTISIPVEVRSGRGKGAARRLRTTGRIPGVAYGTDMAPVALSLDPMSLALIGKSELRWNAPLTLTVDGGDTHLALVQEIDRHPLTRAALHVDFRIVAGDSEVTRKVPIRLLGESPGVQSGGAKLQHLRRSVRLRSAVQSIPADIQIDISTLDLGDKVMMSAVTLPAGCVLAEGDFAVVLCEGRTAKEEAAKEELVFL